jgi:hypothetical protein
MVRPTTRKTHHYHSPTGLAQTAVRAGPALLAVVLLGLPGAGGCDSTGDGQLTDAGGGTPDAPGSVDLPPTPAADAAPGSCLIEQLAPPSEGAAHTQLCGATSYATRPPSSGTHYPTWAAFRVYDKPVPWGFLVHAMEHGAVVIAYNCSNCDGDIAAIKQLWMDTPPKPACPRPPLIVTPDPTLDVPFAAASWGHILRARCFDRALFAAFVTANANHAPEGWPEDCGATDSEANGWCP